MSADRPRSASAAIWLAVLAAAAVWFLLAAGRPLNNPDEGRYAEIPREMLASGDWITPRLNGLAYLEKPPLQYWLTAAGFAAFGASEWTARLVPMSAAFASVWLVWLLGNRLGGARAGWLAAMLLASCMLHFLLGQTLTLDMMFSTLLTGMLTAFCLAQLPSASPRWMLASWLLLALAVLAKGIVALVIAAGVLGIYILWQRDWPLLKKLRLFPGVAILLAINLPWYLAVAQPNPDFWEFFFVREHFQRFLTDVADRVEPWWYFGAVLAAGCVAWLPEMARSLAVGWRSTAARGNFDPQRLLWLWCVFIVGFFSLSQSKLAPYVLPVLPALALLTALRCHDGRLRGLWFGALSLLAFALALLAAMLRPDWLGLDPYVAAVAVRYRWGIIAVVLFALGALAAAWWARRRGRSMPAVSLLAAAWFGSLAVLFASVGQEEQLRSGRALVPLLDKAPDSTPMFSVQTYDQTLPFYLGRTFTLVDYRGELAYGIEREPERAIPSLAEFETRWRALPQGLAVMSEETYRVLESHALPMRVLGRDRRRLVVARP